ncbi:MAG: hypothetical protein ABSE73_15645 [Planctomycetota bacterium]
MAAGDVLPPLPSMQQTWDSNIQAAIPAKSFLPPAVLGPPRLAEAGRQQPMRQCAAAELSTLAPVLRAPGERPALASAAAPARVPAPDPALLVPPWRATESDPPRADTTSDPALAQVRRATVNSIQALTLLPRAATAQTPSRADAARQQTLRPRSATDRPLVARTWGNSDNRPVLPPACAPALVASPDPARTSLPWRETSPDESKADRASDPAQDQVLQMLLAAKPELRGKPAAFLRLAIPDPLELVKPVRLQKPPPDNDPPAAGSDSPPKPVLEASGVRH